MNKKAVINGFVAFAYIFILVSVMNFVSRSAEQPDSILAPIAAISLFTLSAAVMGYLFCLQPIQLYLDGKKKQAVSQFLQTVTVFGIITVVLVGLLFSGILR